VIVLCGIGVPRNGRVTRRAHVTGCLGLLGIVTSGNTHGHGGHAMGRGGVWIVHLARDATHRRLSGLSRLSRVLAITAEAVGLFLILLMFPYDEEEYSEGKGSEDSNSTDDTANDGADIGFGNGSWSWRRGGRVRWSRCTGGKPKSDVGDDSRGRVGSRRRSVVKGAPSASTCFAIVSEADRVFGGDRNRIATPDCG